MRKQWDKRGVSAGKQDSQSNVKSSVENDKKKNGKQKYLSKVNQTSMAETINESDVVVEEDRLDYNTFKENYNEFVTFRKLVNAIQAKVIYFN